MAGRGEGGGGREERGGGGGRGLGEEDMGGGERRVSPMSSCWRLHVMGPSSATMDKSGPKSSTRRRSERASWCWDRLGGTSSWGAGGCGWTSAPMSTSSSRRESSKHIDRILWSSMSLKINFPL